MTGKCSQRPRGLQRLLLCNRTCRPPTRSYGEGTVFYWGLGILKGSQHKQLGHDFLRHISSPASVHALAVNGSGPCTAGELSVAAKSDPAMSIQAEISAVSRDPLPVNLNINQIRDALGEAVQNIVVNDLDTQTELDALAQTRPPLSLTRPGADGPLPPVGSLLVE